MITNVVLILHVDIFEELDWTSAGYPNIVEWARNSFGPYSTKEGWYSFESKISVDSREFRLFLNRMEIYNTDKYFIRWGSEHRGSNSGPWVIVPSISLEEKV
jgi:hypothetical protein